MAGTDASKRPAGQAEPAPAPAVILAGAQLPENVGAAARAMLNCGLVELRLVRPREGWPHERAWPAAAGADEVLDRARLYPTVGEAVGDLHRLYATTARPRDMVKRVVTPRQAALEMRRLARAGGRCGVLFGPERIGLINDEVALADAVLTVPLNPAFASLNLAQAVLVVAYEWHQSGLGEPGETLSLAGRRPARRDEILGFFDHLERALEARRFFRVEAMRPTMVRNLRNLFHRAALTDQEVRTLHGVVTALVGRRKDQL